ESGMRVLRAATTAFLALAVLRIARHVPLEPVYFVTALFSGMCFAKLKTPVYMVYGTVTLACAAWVLSRHALWPGACVTGRPVRGYSWQDAGISASFRCCKRVSPERPRAAHDRSCYPQPSVDPTRQNAAHAGRIRRVLLAAATTRAAHDRDGRRSRG